jgi:hypothetical protein
MSEVRMPLAFKKIIECDKRNVIIPAGRDAGKTINVTILGALTMAKDPSVDGAVARASYGSMRDTLYNEMQGVIDSIPAFDGLFQFGKSPLKMSRIDGGGTIYFTGIGGSNYSRTKGFKPMNRLGFVILDELQELKSERSLNEAIASFRRRYSPNCRIYYLFNPPPQEAHWINQWLAKKKRDPDYAVFELSWQDITPFLSDYDIKEILKTKADDPEYYDWFYMGKATGGFGSVYPMLRKERHVISPSDLGKVLGSLRVSALIIGGDGAVTRDSTAFSAGLLFENGQCVVLTPFVHDPKVNGVLGYHTLVKEYVSRWFWDIVSQYHLGHLQGQQPSPFFREVPCFMSIDQAAPDLVNECRFFLSDRIDINPTSKGTVMEMVASVQSALSRGMVYFLDEGKR